MNETVRLYASPGSHPCATVERALQLKGIPYERTDLLPGISSVMQKAQFGRRTVPGLRVGSYRVTGSRLILRALDSMAPDPPLLPADPAQRARVEEAEEWGDKVLQDEARPIALTAILAKPESMKSFLEGAKVPVPKALAAPLGGPIYGTQMRLLGFSPARVRELVDSLPSRLDHVDELIAAGVIGDAEHWNVADLQIGASVALLARLDDLRPMLAGRPGLKLAEELFPDFRGHVPSGALEVRVPAVTV